MLSANAFELDGSLTAHSMQAKLSAPACRSLHSTQLAWLCCWTFPRRLLFRLGYILASTISGPDSPWHFKSSCFPDTFRNDEETEDNNSGLDSRYIAGIAADGKSSKYRALVSTYCSRSFLVYFILGLMASVTEGSWPCVIG